MEISVEIRPKLGVRKDPEVGEVRGPTDHHSVIVSTAEMRKAGRREMQVGLVSLTPGRPINFLPPINRFPADVKVAIVQAVREQLVSIAEAAANSGLEASSIEEASRLRDNLAAEKTLVRKVFFPPSDKVMEAPPPSNLVDAAGKPLKTIDDVDTFV